MQINISRSAIEQKIETAFAKTLPMLTEIIKKDCNEYCKFDTGALNRSADTHSIPKEGKIIWQTPYAKRQYWAIQTAYKDVKPNATWRWCEVAKQHHKDQWTRQEQRLMEMNL